VAELRWTSAPGADPRGPEVGRLTGCAAET
jgi:hypothetical protein